MIKYWITRIKYEFRNLLRTNNNKFYFCKANNFGDELSYYLYKRLKDEFLNSNLMIVGSILHHHTNELVLGSGFIKKNDVVNIKLPKKSFLRGHLSASQFQEPVDVIADPGLLVSFLYDKIKPNTSTTIIGFIPHVTELKDVISGKYIIPKSVKLIMPTEHPKKVLNEISKCSTIYSSSLHGLIFAHSIGINSQHVVLSDKVIGRGFKFLDYYSVFSNLKYEPINFENCKWINLSPFSKDQKKEIAVKQKELFKKLF